MSSHIIRPGRGLPLKIIFNPQAFGSRALSRKGLEEALDEHRLPFEIIEAGSAEASAAAAESAARDGAVIVAAGGDGTAHAVGNGILRAENPKAVMGLLPLGTGNDLARGLGRLSQGLEPALAALADPNLCCIDVGQVNGRDYFLNGLGIGFDAEVVRKRSLQRFKIPDYIPTVITTIFGYEPMEYRISWPQGSYRGPALMLAAMNGPSEGGGFRLAPKASFQDGLFEVSLIEPVSLWQFARYMLAVRWGRHGDLSMLRQWRTERLEVGSEGALQYHMDGEYHETEIGEPLVIEMKRACLQLIT